MNHELANTVLELVASATGGRAEAEAMVTTETQALTRFANSFIHQNVADSTTRVRLRLHLDGRTAAGSTTLTGTDELRALVQRTVDAASLLPKDPSWPGPAPASPATFTGSADAGTVAATPADRAAVVKAFIEAAGGLETAGYCRTWSTTGTFANSAGQLLEGSAAQAALDGIARLKPDDPTARADGVARLAAGAIADLDGAALGARAAAKARASLDPVELPAGHYEVVFEPDAVNDIAIGIGAYGFGGKMYADGQSFVKLGEAQLDPAITLVADPSLPGAGALPFDLDGTPTRRLELVSAGVSKSLAHDRRTAAEAGGDAASTGHAAGDNWGMGPMANQLHLLPAGEAAPATEVDGPCADSSVAALVAGVERGLLVTDLWYTRVLDPRTLVLTGLTRNGVWLIENGEVTRPVKNFRFTQSYPGALAPQSVRAVGGTTTAIPGGWGIGYVAVPALHLSSWNFTGNASG